MSVTYIGTLAQGPTYEPVLRERLRSSYPSSKTAVARRANIDSPYKKALATRRLNS